MYAPDCHDDLDVFETRKDVEHFNVLGLLCTNDDDCRSSMRCRVRNGKDVQSLVEGCEDLHKQRRAVESQVQENGGTRLQSVLLWERKLILESSHFGQNEGMGNKGTEAFVPIQKKKEDETLAEYYWDGPCHRKPNAVINTLKHAFKRRSTKWWQTTKAIEVKKDLDNHTR